mgnify:CR=1 FL=1
MDILKILQDEFSVSEAHIKNIVELIDDGNTIPFIARYRKEMTGSCDDQKLREINDRLTYLRNLEKRKEEVLSSIEEQGKLTEEISNAVAAAVTLAEVEDIYRPYKQKRKTRAYKEDIGKYYNMTYHVFEDEHYYICHDGRELRHIQTETKQQNGYTQTYEVYGCADCSGCEHKEKCLYKYNPEKDADKNKIMKINEQWEELKAASHANIESEKGILNRQIRSIQTEGHFGDIKENENFRRFNHRSSDKVYKEFMLFAIGRNINKYHRFLHKEIHLPHL